MKTPNPRVVESIKKTLATHKALVEKHPNGSRRIDSLDRQLNNMRRKHPEVFSTAEYELYN